MKILAIAEISQTVLIYRAVDPQDSFKYKVDLNDLFLVFKMQIDWHSQKNELLVNPRLPNEQLEIFKHLFNQLDHLNGHVCLATSGTTQGIPRCVILSKEAILLSALNVNDHLQSYERDVWIHALPNFHVGGLGIWARGFLSKAKICKYDKKWDPFGFQTFVVEKQGSLSALVPTQIYDLVFHGLRAPKSMRAIVVGGGKLSEDLYFKARELGWKLLPSYGLTECASQVATASLESLSESSYPPLYPLKHVELSISNSLIAIKSASLLTAYLQQGRGVCDPKAKGIFITEDHGCFENGILTVLGRESHFLKIGGESVEFFRLESILDQSKMTLGIAEDAALVALPDERLGHIISLVVVAAMVQKEELKRHYDQLVNPFERIRRIHTVDKLPRTALGKLQRDQLIRMLD